MRKRKEITWRRVGVVWIAAAAACVFAWQSWQLRQARSVVVTPPATAAEPVSRPDLRNANLRPGEICLDGRYMRREGSGFVVDQRQDWKCIEQLRRKREGV